ncbi:Hypothetical protein Minf_0416 [Methylacidiphilum infernorum V4]|uniref:Uncharacterized protein n=1 Tax=Methylacidiphilum infernorum (isolate V4) TaxID=481448 RepID=B3DYV2_METI4|nr:Hypothetical protein Minf_0416 [Methylacidiphilum infernorum V4]
MLAIILFKAKGETLVLLSCRSRDFYSLDGANEYCNSL